MADTSFLGGDIQSIVPGNTNFATRYGNSVTSLTGGGYVISWVEDPDGAPTPDGTDIFMQRFNADGSLNGGVTAVNTSLAGSQDSVATAGLTGGGFVTVWSSDADNKIYMQRNDAAGVALGANTAVNTATSGTRDVCTVTTMSTGGYIVSWAESINNLNGTFTIAMRYQRYDSAGVAQGSQATLASETVSEYLTSGFASVDLDAIEVTQLTGGNIAISWTRGGVGASPVAKTTIVNSSGVVVAGPFNPEQTIDNSGSNPQQQVVALGNGNLLVVYFYNFEPSPQTHGDVYGRIYDANGVAVGNEFAIADGTLNRRFDMFAAADGKGGAMVGWVLEHETLNERVIELQHISQTGTLIGDTTWALPHSYTQDSFFDIALLTNGNLVVTGQTGGSGSFSDIQHRLILDGEDGRFSSGNNVVVLGAGGEVVAALEGADTVTGGIGRDYISGGAGVDTISGGDEKDVIHGGTDGDILNGNNGDDLIFGDGGVDTISGGANNDVLDGGTDGDTINGEAGNDTIYGGGGADIIDGGTEDDTIYGFRHAAMDTGPDEVDHDESFINTLNGGTGNDRIYGGRGTDTINGNDGNDFLYGGDDQSEVSGADYFVASNGNDRIDGYDGIDILDYSQSTRAVTMILVNPGIAGEKMTAQTAANNNHPVYIQDIYNVEIIVGTLFADTLLGEELNDTLIGLTGGDTLNGGLGSDTLDYSLSLGAVTINLATNTASGGHANGDIISNFENVKGTALNDTLAGNSDANSLYGNSGNDVLGGSTGNDYFDGGTGEDTVDYRSSTGTNINVNLLLDTASGGHAQSDILDNIDNVYGSTAQRDILIGDNNANKLYGFGGDDSIRGEDGDDFLEGGAGADALNAGAGVNDWVSYRANTAAQANINLLANTYSGGDAQGDTLFFVENLEGSLTLRDILIGNDTTNFIIGNDGGDSIRGEGGNDTIDGGTGADSLNAGAGIDTLTYEKSSAGVTVDLNVATQSSGGDAAGDTLYFFENVTGSIYGDTISGNYQSNRLVGGLGADTLNGGTGSDYLTGGGGADTFRFTDLTFGSDSILDWQDGSDKISMALSIADDFTDFTITDNGTTYAVVRIIGVAGSAIIVQNSIAFTLDAADFVFV